MPTLVLLTHLFDPVSGETLTPGTHVDVSDERAEELIARGTALTPESIDTTEPQERTGEVVQEFTLNDNAYKHLQDTEGDFYTLNGEEVPEDAFVSANQLKTKTDLEAEHANDAHPVTEGADNAPLDQPPAPVEQQAPVTTSPQPTPEEIAATLDATEASPQPPSDEPKN